MVDSVRIMGIDPGLRRTGWGVIESRGNRLTFVACGVLTPPVEDALAIRLVHLHEGLEALVSEYRPEEAAVEETFVNAGPRSALLLGQARGIAVMTPAAMGLDVGEYSANLVKKSVVGTGHADKKQIELMVRTLLPSARFTSSDAADALAIAICHAHHRQHRKLAVSA
ncbi:crossover junction endodeoxyribonuclease RuvC [Pelagibacterium montanilacus]|uniref:crossover junction endodeoxyribonuclease RuvC n=1 Tax=Pelagibacterium montanilacus TaxID=2185280 RepID=UPI000F8F1BC5|nr:crossover junction endodeoxyribonuclease RuvC [Pelagibacterium montanilacus]